MEYGWTVTWYSKSSAAFEVLGDVQSLTIRKGRANVQDPFRASTATITGRLPGDLPNIEIGDAIVIEATKPAFSAPIFGGAVADLQIDYGTIQALDTWTLHVEDPLAILGRAYLPSLSWSSGVGTSEAAEDVVVSQNVVFYADPTYPSSSFVSAQNVTGLNALDVLNTLAFTEQAFIVGVANPPNGDPEVFWTGRSQYGFLPPIYGFVDATGNTPYEDAVIETAQFGSLADTLANRVTINPEGLSPQTAGAADGRTFDADSYDVSTTQAGNLALYVLATLDVNTPVPQRVTMVSGAQTNDAALLAFSYVGQGRRVEISLRGNTYDVFLNGGTLTAVPGNIRYSFDLVSAEALNFFILDDPNFGVLDSNRLGF